MEATEILQKENTSSTYDCPYLKRTRISTPTPNLLPLLFGAFWIYKISTLRVMVINKLRREVIFTWKAILRLFFMFCGTDHVLTSHPTSLLTPAGLAVEKKNRLQRR
jgi:hypothetical protein